MRLTSWSVQKGWCRVKINGIISVLEYLATGADEVANEQNRYRKERKRASRDAKAIREAITMLRTHPDAQPNEPLALEELREMDGQPVWVETIYGGGALGGSSWALVEIQEDGNIFLNAIGSNGWTLSEDDDDYDPDLDDVSGVYRRPPKED